VGGGERKRERERDRERRERERERERLDDSVKLTKSMEIICARTLFYHFCFV
jgi:hypothetical protein